jgi:hypothetical protein
MDMRHKQTSSQDAFIVEHIVTYSGSISQWNFIALKIQYTTVNYNQ